MYESSSDDIPEVGDEPSAEYAAEESYTAAVASERLVHVTSDEASRKSYAAADTAEGNSRSNYLESGEAMWSAGASGMEGRIEGADSIEGRSSESVPEPV